MKKVFAAISFVLYFAVSTGIVINLHYCMSRFDSLQLGAAKSEVCGKCGMHTDDSNGCCHDEVKIVKLQNDQLVSQLQYQFQSQDAITGPQPSILAESLFSAAEKITVNNHSPPISRQDIYLLHCVFRI